jgi:hypothetical protein
MKMRQVLIVAVSVAALGAIVVARTYRQAALPHYMGIEHGVPQFGYSRYTSPPAKTEADVAGDHIQIDYYAPSAHGRKIMGALVPYGVVWCTGANWATKITTQNDLKIGDLNLPKGSYSIWTLPGEKEWMLIVNKETGQFHLNYDQSQDFGRTKMNLKTLNTPVETFRIEVRPGAGDQGTLALLWENTEASIPFTVKR